MQIIRKLDEPLCNLDSASQTYGCRHTNPDICKNNMLAGICAFTRKDGICKSPSKAWRKQYRFLKSRIK